MLITNPFLLPWFLTAVGFYVLADALLVFLCCTCKLRSNKFFLLFGVFGLLVVGCAIGTQCYFVTTKDDRVCV